MWYTFKQWRFFFQKQRSKGRSALITCNLNHKYRCSTITKTNKPWYKSHTKRKSLSNTFNTHHSWSINMNTQERSPCPPLLLIGISLNQEFSLVNEKSCTSSYWQQIERVWPFLTNKKPHFFLSDRIHEKSVTLKFFINCAIILWKVRLRSPTPKFLLQFHQDVTKSWLTRKSFATSFG